MTDRMRVIPFDQLIRWIFGEMERDHSIFGIPQEKFHRARRRPMMTAFGDPLENPLGPAAGPHTQLAQNIIAAYLTGSRYFELKTVQKLDGADLPVDKPCISAKDEGYNVEWSTELTVADAYNEYVKAWFALHLLAKELSLGEQSGFIFNMSVGYDLEGIQTPKVDAFIEGLKDASQSVVWQECREICLKNAGIFKKINIEMVKRISTKICKSITLSTLHGCPPQAIEEIARYLIGEKRLHTYVKLNPTLLGYEYVRKTLDHLGYEDMVFAEKHFKNDLQFEEAVPMIARLQAYAQDRGLVFGVKLSNTLPVQICNNELPGEEMYMSGRALYPLTINLAYRLAKAFDGELNISYSGGANFFNVDRIDAAGIRPITFATTILKPGGYLRIKQMAELLEEQHQPSPSNGVNLESLKSLAENAMSDPHYRKDSREVHDRKLNLPLPLTDCFVAPCTKGCPIGQDVPEYIRLLGEERYLEAFEVITAKNPLPFITGTLCNHPCSSKCTRMDYDAAVEIRGLKLEAAEQAYTDDLGRLATPKVDDNTKIAIIGAGPAGLSAAYFLGKNGFAVTVYERKHEIGGVINIAPDFRISKEALRRDLAMVEQMGVKFRLGVDENFSIDMLKQDGFQYIFIATGAWRPGPMELDVCDKPVINVLELLERYNKDPKELRLGKRVAVIGGGNSAMDAARAAKRVAGVENVWIIYRRTRREMPADREELRLALADGVELKELLAPVSLHEGTLRCQRMILGTMDSSGRKIPLAVTGEYLDIPVDTVIAAVGERVETEVLKRNGIEFDSHGYIRVDPRTGETNLANVFIGGDALRGPATIVEAIADATRFAKTVMTRESGEGLSLEKPVGFDLGKQRDEVVQKKGVLSYPGSASQAYNRCLECSVLCNLCVEVCPNRANIAVVVRLDGFRNRNQIIHIDGMCNACGNCRDFCPYDGAPYREKLTLYWNQADFADSRNAGFYLVDEETIRFKVRFGKEIYDLQFNECGVWESQVPTEVAVLIWHVFKDYRYLFC